MIAQDWLDKTGRTSASFAREHGLGAATIWKYVTGKTMPSFPVMALFAIASKGEVEVKDWIKTFPKWREWQKSRDRSKGKRKRK